MIISNRDRGGAAEVRAGVGGTITVSEPLASGAVYRPLLLTRPTGAAGSYRPGEGRLAGHRLAKLVSGAGGELPADVPVQTDGRGADADARLRLVYRHGDAAVSGQVIRIG